MQKILIATDFSVHAEYAFMAAASISKKNGAKLILLHVIDRALTPTDDSYVNYHNLPGHKLIVTNIQDKLDALVNDHQVKDVKIIYELRSDVHRTIIKHADRHKVDLIIMGAYGTMGSDDILIGSNTTVVLLAAKMPVLVVRQDLADFNIENMVFASEFFGEVYKVFAKMKIVIDLFKTNIHLLKVNTPNHFQRTQKSMNLMTEFSKEFGLEHCTKNIYNDLSIEDGILNFTKQIDADLIAITPDGFWRLNHIFNKNITSELMKKSVKAILSMKTQQPTNPA